MAHVSFQKMGLLLASHCSNRVFLSNCAPAKNQGHGLQGSIGGLWLRV